MSEPHPQLGRYQVTHVLGRGAMGLVYLADDPLIGRRVAVKVIRPEPGLDPEEAEDRRVRFEREFRSAGTLSHPSIVTVYDVGHEGGTSFIAMEYVQGDSLQQLMQRPSPLPESRICEILLQIAAGLDFAHQARIVHRDVKPANILLSHDGHAKITDFGVAKQASVTLTRTGTVLGTPAYMSPEQITGAEVSGASDQFSLGIIAYELLTGARPFAGDSAPSILYKIVQERPQPATAVRRDLPLAIDTVFDRALAKDPTARFQSCVAFVRALSEALGVGIGDATLGAGARHADHDATIKSDPGDFHFDPDPAHQLPTGSYAAVRRGNHNGLAAGVLLTLAVLGLGLFFLLRSPSLRTTAPTMVAIETAIPGAEIRIDGIDSGLRSPATVELIGKAGDSRLLELVRHGQVVASRELVLGGEPATWTAEEGAAQLALHVITNPAGAEISIDGRVVGSSPLVADVGAEGTLRLVSELDGYETLEEDLDLAVLAAEGPTPRIERTLAERPPAARLSVRGAFAVDVRVRGRSQTLRAGQSLDLEPGRVTLELSQPRVRYRERREVVLEPGRELSIDLPRAVTVQVAAQPGNCTVWIGGIKADVTPFSQELVIGSHDFEFRWAESSRTVTVAVRDDGQRIFEAQTP